MIIPDHYRLHAYVCDGGACVREVDDLGSTTFAKVFQRLPDGCRYAVVSQYDVKRMSPMFSLLDLWETHEIMRTLTLVPPKPLVVSESLDVAIMHGTLLYGEGG